MRQPAAFGIDVCSRFYYVDLQLLSLFSMSVVQMELQESLDLLSVCSSRLPNVQLVLPRYDTPLLGDLSQ